MAKRKTKTTRIKPKKVAGNGFVMEDVPNPYGNGTERVQKRHSSNLIETMHKRGQISAAQYLAAERYFIASVYSGGGKDGAIDLTKVKVDTFGNGQSVQMSTLTAQEHINQANKVLKRDDINRLQAIVIGNATLRRFCLSEFKADNTRLQMEQSKALKDSLTELAIVWGFESRARRVA